MAFAASFSPIPNFGEEEARPCSLDFTAEILEASFSIVLDILGVAAGSSRLLFLIVTLVLFLEKFLNLLVFEESSSRQSKYSFVTRGLSLDKRAGITTLEPVPKRVQENHSWITSFRVPV